MGKPIPTELLEDADQEPNSALSYLDIVTAAFGAAIFLLFVFATLPLDRAGGAGAATYIDVHVSYLGTAVIEIQLEHNGKMILRTLDPTFSFDPRTGVAKLSASPAFQDVLISNKEMAASGTQQHIGFRVLGPAPGAWVVHANAAESVAPFSETASTPITLQVETACAAPCIPDLEETQALLPAHEKRQTLARIDIPES